ncbi:MAG: DUF4352 domain-containing protein [Lachnospiraceae bacterium]|nr:DUF4352 domain-containing protein [Lachnospiraceae bacterium]
MKCLIGIMTVASAVLLTSCAAQVPELSKFDNDKAAEYMAGEMLKYDADYAYALEYDRSVLEATPTPAPTQAPVVTPKPDQSSDNPEGSATGDTPEEPAIQEVSGADILGIPGAEIQFVSASVKSSYGSKYESIVASKGKELLILKFQIKNTGQSAQEINLFDQKLDYTLSQGDQTKTPERTSAEGDLTYFKTKISSGKSKQGVLIFEVDQGSGIDGSSLHIINGMKQTTITLS